MSSLRVLLLQVLVHGALGITPGLYPVLQEFHFLPHVDLEALGVGGGSMILNLWSSRYLGTRGECFLLSQGPLDLCLTLPVTSNMSMVLQMVILGEFFVLGMG